MSAALSERQVKQILERLDAIRLELIRLRAALLPEEEPSEEELREIKEAEREIEEGARLTAVN